MNRYPSIFGMDTMPPERREGELRDIRCEQVEQIPLGMELQYDPEISDMEVPLTGRDVTFRPSRGGQLKGTITIYDKRDNMVIEHEIQSVVGTLTRRRATLRESRIIAAISRALDR